MSFTDVFPPNNLPASSAPWGRKIEELARQNSYALTNTSISTTGDNRAIAGQMGALGRQISELQSRETATVERGSALSVTSTGTNTFFSSDWVLTLPGGDGQRSSIVNFSTSVSPGANTTLFAEIFSSSQTFYAGTGFTGSTTGAPPNWVPELTASFAAKIPATGLGLTVRLWASNFVAGTVVSSFNDPTFVYTLFDRVN